MKTIQKGKNTSFFFYFLLINHIECYSRTYHRTAPTHHTYYWNKRIMHSILCLSFYLQSGLCSSSELETSRGHIRIQHLTAAASSSTSTGNCSTIGLRCTSASSEMNQSRFPRLQTCAHFHYDFTDIGPISVIASSEAVVRGRSSRLASLDPVII